MNVIAGYQGAYMVLGILPKELPSFTPYTMARSVVIAVTLFVFGSGMSVDISTGTTGSDLGTSDADFVFS